MPLLTINTNQTRHNLTFNKKRLFFFPTQMESLFPNTNGKFGGMLSAHDGKVATSFYAVTRAEYLVTKFRYCYNNRV
jgi:hypothetical protein